MNESGADAAPIAVHFVLLPGSLILDWAGPAEALRMANRCLREAGRPETFSLHFIGPASQARASVGATISAIEPLPAALPVPSWLVLIGQTGEAIDPNVPGVPMLLRWLRGLQPEAERLEVLTVCAGAVLAAHAGLLYLDEIRLAVAETALGGGRSVGQAAEMAGFTSDTQLRRAWHRHGRGGTPSGHAQAHTAR